VNHNPLDEKPKITFDGSDWAILVLCIAGLLFMIVQLFRSVIS
jgi:hypothetical protein